MLFGYPIAATAENWLHECLVEMVQTIHAIMPIMMEGKWRLLGRTSSRRHTATNYTAARDCTIDWPNILRLPAS